MPTNLPLAISFTVDSLPEGWSGTPQEFAEAIAERLHGYGSGNFLIGVSGGTTPTSDQGLFVSSAGTTDGHGQLLTWSATASKYLPIYSAPVGSIIMYAASANPETIGEVEPNYILCNGHEYLVAEFPELYSKIGILWGGSLGVSFKVPDLRGRIPLGAGIGVDYLSASKALIERTIGMTSGYQGHDFVSNVPKAPNGPTTPANQSVGGLVPGTTYTTGLPATTVLNFIIRVR